LWRAYLIAVRRCLPVGTCQDGNALEVLVTDGAVPPGDVLRVGLTVLSCWPGSA
jgi:hypothetical protein